MSKVVGKNKSGTTLVNAIIENCKKSEGDENGKDYNRNLTDNFCKNFLLYFKVVTGKEFSFGELSDSVFNELKENLVRTTQKYEVKKLHEWFKVNSWKDVFPDDIEDTQEWIFRENMHTLIIDLYKKIFDTENEDVFSHNGIKARELIYDLMGIDFSYYFKSKIIQGETDEETVSKEESKDNKKEQEKSKEDSENEKLIKKKEYERKLLEKAEEIYDKAQEQWEIERVKKIKENLKKKSENRKRESKEKTNKLIRDYVDELMKNGVSYLDMNIQDSPETEELLQWYYKQFWEDRTNINIENIDSWISETREKFHEEKNSNFLVEHHNEIVEWENTIIIKCLFNKTEPEESDLIRMPGLKELFKRCKSKYEEDKGDLGGLSPYSWVNRQRKK